jgi:hypothetical protein
VFLLSRWERAVWSAIEIASSVDLFERYAHFWDNGVDVSHYQPFEALHVCTVTVGTTSSMHLLLKPVTDVVYSSKPSEESCNIFQSVLAK